MLVCAIDTISVEFAPAMSEFVSVSDDAPIAMATRPRIVFAVTLPGVPLLSMNDSATDAVDEVRSSSFVICTVPVEEHVTTTCSVDTNLNRLRNKRI